MIYLMGWNAILRDAGCASYNRCYISYVNDEWAGSQAVKAIAS